MRLYIFELKWFGDESYTYILIEANTKKDAEKSLKQRLKEKDYSTEFEKYNCKPMNLENGMCFIN
jgi:hypothetical protein